MRRPHYVEPEDDGLVGWRGNKLVTPEQAQVQYQRIMAGFDDLLSDIRNALNYASSNPDLGFNASKHVKAFTKWDIKIAKKSAAINLMDELGL